MTEQKKMETIKREHTLHWKNFQLPKNYTILLPSKRGSLQHPVSSKNPKTAQLISDLYKMVSDYFFLYFCIC